MTELGILESKVAEWARSRFSDEVQKAWESALRSDNADLRSAAVNFGALLMVVDGFAKQKHEGAAKHLRPVTPVPAGPDTVDQSEPPGLTPAATMVQLEGLNHIPYCPLCETEFKVIEPARWNGASRTAARIAIGVVPLCDCAIEIAKRTLIDAGYVEAASKKETETPEQLRLVLTKKEEV